MPRLTLSALGAIACVVLWLAQPPVVVARMQYFKEFQSQYGATVPAIAMKCTRKRREIWPRSRPAVNLRTSYVVTLTLAAQHDRRMCVARCERGFTSRDHWLFGRDPCYGREGCRGLPWTIVADIRGPQCRCPPVSSPTSA